MCLPSLSILNRQERHQLHRCKNFQPSQNKLCEKLKIWRETTTISPSGLHLGHYKALLDKHAFLFISEDEDEGHQRQREELDQLVMKHFCSCFLLMGAQGGCQKFNKRTERYVFVLTRAHSITELGQKTRNLPCP